ncbi:unnamed protein product [Closterium sp. NIES-65]|nr:unnamed protein product [Closterium sp. NIES-65]
MSFLNLRPVLSFMSALLLSLHTACHMYSRHISLWLAGAPPCPVHPLAPCTPSPRAPSCPIAPPCPMHPLTPCTPSPISPRVCRPPWRPSACCPPWRPTAALSPGEGSGGGQWWVREEVVPGVHPLPALRAGRELYEVAIAVHVRSGYGSTALHLHRLMDAAHAAPPAAHAAPPAREDGNPPAPQGGLERASHGASSAACGDATPPA